MLGGKGSGWFYTNVGGEGFQVKKKMYSDYKEECQRKKVRLCLRIGPFITCKNHMESKCVLNSQLYRVLRSINCLSSFAGAKRCHYIEKINC